MVEGLPAGLTVERDGIAHELARRRLGYGRGNRMKLEQDELEIMGGVRHGVTLGSPVAVIVRNTEWPKWSEEMSPDPGEPKRPMTTPRPGHADLVGMLKYDVKDARNILERASARETAARTVVGYLAKQLLATIGVDVLSHVVAIGTAQSTSDVTPEMSDLAAIDASPVRAFDHAAQEAMIAEIEAAKADRDTLGGVVEVVVHGLPPGLGSHVHWDRRLDARLAEALMSIQAMKAVEVGDGLETARRRGSAAHDEIYYTDGEFTRTNGSRRWHRGRDDHRPTTTGSGGHEAHFDGHATTQHCQCRDEGIGGRVPGTVRRVRRPCGWGCGRTDGRNRAGSRAPAHVWRRHGR